MKIIKLQGLKITIPFKYITFQPLGRTDRTVIVHSTISIFMLGNHQYM